MTTTKNPQGTATGSFDLELTRDIHALFKSDGRTVRLEFYFHGDSPDGNKYGQDFAFPSEEAVRLGRQIEESGSPGQFPITATVEVVKAFGRRLKEYGETGR